MAMMAGSKSNRAGNYSATDRLLHHLDHVEALDEQHFTPRKKGSVR
jgi:hypothetical protein